MKQQKKIPTRMCVGCGEMKPKKELVRVVRAPERQNEDGTVTPGAISLDRTGKKPGRGAYVCPNAECLRIARKAHKLERTLGCPIPDEIYDRMEAELTHE